MCGLISYAGATDYSVDKLKILFLLNEHRGKDSCGAYIKGKGTVKVEGEVSKTMLPHIHIPDSTLFLGHVRQGTVGSKTKENSHPFTEGNLVQIHNGRIDNYISIAGKFDLGNDYKVDSHVMLKLFKKFQDEGKENFIEAGLQELDGHIALMLHDKNKPNIVYFYRNVERPLFYGHVEEGNYYFSSLEEPLLIIGVKKENIVNVEVDQIYQLNYETNELTKTPFVKHIKIKERIPILSPVRTRNVSSYPSYIKPSTDAFNKLSIIYDKLYTDRPKSKVENDPIIEKNTTIEYVNDKNETVVGKIIASCRPYNNVYVVVDDKGCFSFVDRSLITEVEEDIDDKGLESNSIRTANKDIIDHMNGMNDDDLYVLEGLSTGTYISFYDTDGAQKVGRISYIDMRSASILVDLPRKDGEPAINYHADIEPRDIVSNVDKGVFDRAEALLNERDTEYSYQCSTCGDEGVVNSKPCPSCKSEFVESFIDEDAINYDDYEDAIDLFCALSNCPGFDDDNGEFNDIVEEDSALANKIKELKNKTPEYNKMMGSEDVKVYEDNHVAITSCMNRRSVLLQRMIELAKEKEEQVNLMD